MAKRREWKIDEQFETVSLVGPIHVREVLPDDPDLDELIESYKLLLIEVEMLRERVDEITEDH